MKKIAVMIAVLAVSMIWAMTAIAGQCPNLIKQVDAKLAGAGLSHRDSDMVKKLQKEGAIHHKKGEHAAAISALNKALAQLGG